MSFTSAYLKIDRENIQESNESRLWLVLPRDTTETSFYSLFDPVTVARLLLFNGDTQFHTDTVRKALSNVLLLTKESRHAALLIPKLRGKERNIMRSDLERACHAE